MAPICAMTAWMCDIRRRECSCAGVKMPYQDKLFKELGMNGKNAMDLRDENESVTGCTSFNSFGYRKTAFTVELKEQLKGVRRAIVVVLKLQPCQDMTLRAFLASGELVAECSHHRPACRPVATGNVYGQLMTLLVISFLTPHSPANFTLGNCRPFCTMYAPNR